MEIPRHHNGYELVPDSDPAPSEWNIPILIFRPDLHQTWRICNNKHRDGRDPGPNLSLLGKALHELGGISRKKCESGLSEGMELYWNLHREDRGAVGNWLWDRNHLHNLNRDYPDPKQRAILRDLVKAVSMSDIRKKHHTSFATISSLKKEARDALATEIRKANNGLCPFNEEEIDWLLFGKTNRGRKHGVFRAGEAIVSLENVTGGSKRGILGLPLGYEGAIPIKAFLPVFAHRKALIEKTGLPLIGMHAHHLDEDKTNNHPDNLLALPRWSHRLVHARS